MLNIPLKIPHFSSHYMWHVRCQIISGYTLMTPTPCIHSQFNTSHATCVEMKMVGFQVGCLALFNQRSISYSILLFKLNWVQPKWAIWG